MLTCACDFDWSIAAAWVQAVGSILAIFVAVIVFRAQARHESRARQADSVSSLVSTLWGIAELVSESQVMMDEIVEKIRYKESRLNFFDQGYDKEFLFGIRTTLMSFNPWHGTGSTFTAEYYKCVRIISEFILLVDCLSENKTAYNRGLHARLSSLVAELSERRFQLVTEIQVVETYKYGESPRDSFLKRYSRRAQAGATRFWDGFKRKASARGW